MITFPLEAIVLRRPARSRFWIWPAKSTTPWRILTSRRHKLLSKTSNAGCRDTYDYPDLASRSINGLDFDECGSRPSADNMTEEESAVNFDPVAAARTEFPMFFQIQPVLKALA